MERMRDDMGDSKENLLELYGEVFYPDGTIKLCGRDKCRSLMIACSDLSGGEKFGDIKTGIMDVDKIKGFVESIIAKDKVESL